MNEWAQTLIPDYQPLLKTSDFALQATTRQDDETARQEKRITYYTHCKSREMECLLPNTSTIFPVCELSKIAKSGLHSPPIRHLTTLTAGVNYGYDFPEIVYQYLHLTILVKNVQ
jgi:hypothetical protein